MAHHHHRVIALALLGLATFVGSIALTDQAIQTGRRWLLVAVVVILSLAAVQLLLDAKGRFSFLLGGMAFLVFSLCGFCLAFSGELLDGGVPFLPAAWNQLFGQILFGLGALFSAGGSFSFLCRASKTRNNASEPS